MVQTCTKCSRTNPAEAVYCYFDGFVLAGHARTGGPVAVGAQMFPHLFVFPTGRTCRSFDELALACQEEWATARDLLQQGYLESFLSGLGRADLALAAREAARFPDRDRGLDQLLATLPTNILDEPRLRLEPQEVNLGVLPLGTRRSFNLHLENQGMRLLYGSVSCADNWLYLGDAHGTSEKHFEFTHEQVIPVHIAGDRLRASPRPIEGKLLVESNGGVAAVVVRAEVPVLPFPEGVLAGACTPREVAEKARALPKQAAPLFETGVVARWYQDNGWTYPVQGPSASGLGAVQQFFEALGLTPPPRVEINVRKIALQGQPGGQLTCNLEVSSREKRPVYAHAVSNQPWLEVGRARLNGRVAVLNLSVPAVPNRPGETLTAQLTVQSNGNQRFVVPVTLQVGASFDFLTAPEQKAEGRRQKAEGSKREASRSLLWLHALPAVLLVLAVFGVVALDLIQRPARVGSGTNAEDPSSQEWTFDRGKLKDPRPRLVLRFDQEMERFGLEMRDVPDPRPEYQDRLKRLTADEQGRTNNTIVRIGGADYKFGFKTPSNSWVVKKKPIPGRDGYYSEMKFGDEQVLVTQQVEIVPGQSGYLDTCLVYYKVQNYGTGPQKVGLRVMIDTYIGANDGVPFTVPGQKGFVRTNKDFTGSEIPDYIEAVENPDDPKDPGTVVRMGLKGLRLPGVELDELDRVRICRFPGSGASWDWDPQPMGDDSCVALYWNEKELEKGEVRHLAFTYGLSRLDLSGSLALSVPGQVQPERDFVATLYVWDAREGQKVSLVLPATGLTLAPGETAEKTLTEGGKRVPVSWRLRAGGPGSYPLGASSGGASATPVQVEVKRASIFG